MEKFLIKELPIGEPPIKCFLYDAYPLSILAVKEDFKPWLFSNYIQLCCYENFIQRNEVFLEFFGPDQAFHSPYLKTQYMSWEAFPKDIINIVNYVISCINKGYYYYCYVDEYYIPHRGAYGKFHFMHDLFIYGYNDEKQEFMVLGYDDNRHFVRNMISYVDFEEAFMHNNADKEKFYWTDRIYLFKYNEDAEYSLDIQSIIELTEDYLHSRNTDERYRRYQNPIKNKVFGIKIYDCLINYYELLMEHKLTYDVRIPYLLWEHKKCMKERLAYLINKMGYDKLNRCYDDYNKLQEKAKVILNFMIKYQKKENPAYLYKIIDLLKQLRSEELDTLERMLLYLKQYSSDAQYK